MGSTGGRPAVIERLFTGDAAQRFWGSTAGQLAFAAMVILSAALVIAAITGMEALAR